jgi:hypothetical protein
VINTRRATTALTRSAAKVRPQVADSNGSTERSYPTTPSEARQARSAPSILLVDSDAIHARRFVQCLHGRGVLIEECQSPGDALNTLGRRADCYDLVVVNISDSSKPWERIIYELQEASAQSRRQEGPLFLCISCCRKPPQMQLMLERKGARVAYEE